MVLPFTFFFFPKSEKTTNRRKRIRDERETAAAEDSFESQSKADQVDSPVTVTVTAEKAKVIGRRMLKLRHRECCFLFCLIVFVFAVPCYSHETLFDGKTLYPGKELWKETLPLESGSRVYKLQGLKSNSWYEVKISYPASIPALFTLQLLKNGVMGFKLNHMRRLLNTEKLIFKTESFEEVDDNKDGLYVLVTVEPQGIVAIPNFEERPFIIYNIVCEEQLLGIPYSSWSVVVLVVLCLVAALTLPRFLPSYFLIKDGDRDR